jgi:hypothetical protein
MAASRGSNPGPPTWVSPPHFLSERHGSAREQVAGSVDHCLLQALPKRFGKNAGSYLATIGHDLSRGWMKKIYRRLGWQARV